MKRKENTADVAVVVGRFQVANLHDGHMELLSWVANNHKKVVVVLGVNPIPGTRSNPLDFEARYLMLSEQFPRFIFLPLRDVRTNEEWSANLDRLVASVVNPSQSVVLYGCRKSFIDFYTGIYPTEELVGEQPLWNGSEEREAIKREVRDSADFRAGVIWQSFNSYPKVITTVDVAIIDGDNVLLVQKPGETLWRFPGGFSDPKLISFEGDACREAFEETGAKIDNITYIGSFNIDDWRYRGSTDKIRTMFFKAGLVPYLHSAIKAADDVAILTWAKLSTLHDKDIVEEHRCLYWALMNLLKVPVERTV